MYLLIEKDCFCEMNVSDDLHNLFKFESPYNKNERKIIKRIKQLLQRKNNYTKDRFIQEFNRFGEYEIVYV